MQIAAVSGHLPGDVMGGAEYQAWLIATGLQQLRHEVTLVAAAGPGPSSTLYAQRLKHLLDRATERLAAPCPAVMIAQYEGLLTSLSAIRRPAAQPGERVAER